MTRGFRSSYTTKKTEVTERSHHRTTSHGAHTARIVARVLRRRTERKIEGLLGEDRGPGSSVGIVTDYGLEGPGSNPGGGRDFPPVQTGPVTHPASCKMGTGSFPGVKCGRGVLLTTHPLLVPRSWKSRAIPLPTLWATLGM